MTENKKNRDKTWINSSYPVTQLIKALSSQGKTAQQKIEQWKSVIDGIVDGTIQIGSRAPLSGMPIWVTPEVVHGGFATGAHAAAGPLKAHEQDKLEELEENLSIDIKTLKIDSQRELLNTYYISESGQKELCGMLANGCFRVTVPEEGALISAAWLIKNDHLQAASKLIETIEPYFDRLRFYPQPHKIPLRTSTNVFVRPVGEVIETLKNKRAQSAVVKMNETLSVWSPMYLRAVELFLETVEGDLPHFKTTNSGALLRAENGQPIVEGGWPCRNYDKDWAERAQTLLSEYDEARRLHTGCGKPEKKKENFYRLRTHLKNAAKDPMALSARDVGMIRKILASYVTAHGEPQSQKNKNTQKMQAYIVSQPLQYKLAEVVADRFSDFDSECGIPKLRELLHPLTEDEVSQCGGRVGDALPDALVLKALPCLEAPLETLVDEGLLKSSESMAVLLPVLTARMQVTAIRDEELARLFEAVYQAFRMRRSLLLLNLSHQAKLTELPWINIMEPWLSSNESTRTAAKDVLKKAAILSVRYYPQTIIPNKLVSELRALSQAAKLNVPFVNELAADIFMGDFSMTFLEAAKRAASLLKGSFYEKYYSINYDAIERLEVEDKKKYGTACSPGFAKLCNKRAVAANNIVPGSWSVALNGAVIEQSQIITTHNLASLLDAIEYKSCAELDFEAAAKESFRWISSRLQLQINDWQVELQNIKNTAYSWRQMIFFLSLLEEERLHSFLEWYSEHMAVQSDWFNECFEPASLGLRLVAEGVGFDADGTHSSGARRLLGWSTTRHWLRSKD